MDFREAERFLLLRRRLGMKFGLRNIRRAMDILGHPEQQFPSVHVTGSKGKGSFCAMLESILLAARYPVGLYTSPHLVSVRERIRVAGRPAGPSTFARLVGEVRRRLGEEGAPLTYFEWITAMAFLHFAARKVPLAIVEVGLGGRLDATNVLPSSLSAVTSIEKEHAGFLGGTLGEIAREKGAIVKRGSVMVASVASPAARRVLDERARSVGAEALWLHREASWEVTGHSLRGLRMDLEAGGERYTGLRVGIAGRHQARNAALAVVAAGALRSRGFKVGRRAVRRGLAAARWPGRCDYRPGTPSYFIDGAHTPVSVRAFAETVGELLPSRRRVLLFGVLADKNVRRLAEPLFGLAEAVIVVRPPEERGAGPGEVLGRLPAALRDRCSAAADVDEGMSLADRAAGRGGVVLVAGSLFLAGAVLARLGPAGRRSRR